MGLARRGAPSGIVPALDRIEQETERLNVMIGELLTLNLLESTSERFGAKIFDLAELMEEVVRDAEFSGG